MKCKVCDGSGITKGYDAILGKFFDMECFACNGSGEVDHYEEEKEEPLTNEEWIKSMNTEQLAEWIAKIVDCDCCPVKRKFCDDNPCKIRFVEWLKQPHTLTSK